MLPCVHMPRIVNHFGQRPYCYLCLYTRGERVFNRLCVCAQNHSRRTVTHYTQFRIHGPSRFAHMAHFVDQQNIRTQTIAANVCIQAFDHVHLIKGQIYHVV